MNQTISKKLTCFANFQDLTQHFGERYAGPGKGALVLVGPARILKDNLDNKEDAYMLDANRGRAYHSPTHLPARGNI